MTEPTQFLTNEKGEKIAVVIRFEDYQEILEKLEELEDMHAFDEAEASGEALIPAEQVFDEIRRNRR